MRIVEKHGGLPIIDRNILADAITEFPEIIRKGENWNHAKHSLLHKCRELFAAEVCAIFLVQDGNVLLDAHIGYTRADGSPIRFEILREKLIYRVSHRHEWGKSPFDGITGLVASRGEEFYADSWEEIKHNPNYAGKPDSLGIWSEERKFRCMFAVPLTIGNKTVGVLKVENKISGNFDSVDREILRKLASLFSIAVGQAYLGHASEEQLTRETPTETDSDRRREVQSLAETYDRFEMASVIERSPGQIEYALSDPNLPNMHSWSFEKAVVVGMGGSALPVEVLNEAFRDSLSTPVFVSRHYDLPALVDDRTLIIASSFSGNTEEVLSAIDGIPSDAKNIIVISAGGKLASLAEERHYPYVHIPHERESEAFQPRCATGYIVTYMARILAGAGILKDPEPELNALLTFLQRLDVRPDAEMIAHWFAERIPVFYTDATYERSIARISKIKMNENAKRPAFFNSLPEANHNEMIGFSRPYGKFAFLYLRDPDGHPRVHQRFDVMRTVFSDKHFDHVDFREWVIPGITKLQKIFSALTFADWCSYTVALLDHVDPTPVSLVEDFKDVLGAAGPPNSQPDRASS